MGCCNSKNVVEQDLKLQRGFCCPKCSETGNEVELITVKSLLKPVYLDVIREDTQYRWCATYNCEVSYFSNDRQHYFYTYDLTVKATIKDRSLNVNVCYCFNHTRQSVLDEINLSGYSTVVEDVKAKMKERGCACTTSNPQGTCCLGNVMDWVKEVSKDQEQRISYNTL